MKYLMSIVIFLPIIFAGGCSDSFSPKAVYEQDYSLNCVIRGDDSIQIATITRSYDVEGFDPYQNKYDPSVLGASVHLIYKGKTYKFRDTSVTREDTSRYKTPRHYYYTKFYGNKMEEGDPIYINAELTNGIKLSSETRVAPNIQFARLEGQYVLPPKNEEQIVFAWRGGDLNTMYHPRFYIIYEKKVDGKEILMQKDVPYGYGTENGNTFPVYPTPANKAGIVYSKKMLDSAMADISKGEPVKANFKILGTVVDLLVFDDNLSKYVGNQSGFLDPYTIRIDQNDFTNINGGYGFFGTYKRFYQSRDFNQEYILSFGYKLPGN